MPVAEKTKAVIIENKQVSKDIYSMWLEEKNIANLAEPGQFLSLYCRDHSKLLPRPISICEIDRKNGRIRLVYRVVGSGTMEIAQWAEGEMVDVMGPLGNGFPFEGKKAILVGGGIGIPPMLELAKQLDCEKQIVLGYRDQTFLDQEFEPYGTVHIATEDGRKGTKGTVIDAITEQGLQGDVIFACGPTPMLKGVKTYALEHGLKAYISMEERMACGVGACLGCVCKTKELDHYSNGKNKRICKDGPVFLAEEVEL